MALHNIRGKEGEEMAVQHLQQLGYHIQHCNWKQGYYEIDIIAVKDKKIHFIEVKTRHSRTFGYPEDGVTRKKFDNLKKAAEYYLDIYPYWKLIQFDILAITRLKDLPVDFFLIEDVYL